MTRRFFAHGAPDETGIAVQGLPRHYPARRLPRPDQTYGAAVRAARRRRGLSQRALAVRAGINSDTMNRVERGCNTTTATIEKLRRVLPEVRYEDHA